MTEVAESGTKTIDCAWCACSFEDVVDLLEHVEAHNIDSLETDLHAAA